MEDPPVIPEKLIKRMGGRKPGQLNKRTKLAMSTNARIFAFLGGETAHLNWCKKHEDWWREQYILHQFRREEKEIPIDVDAQVVFKWITDGQDDNGPL